VLEVHQDWFSPQWKKSSSRILRRLLKGTVIGEYNEAVLENAKHFKPDIVIVFKGGLVRASTLRSLHEAGARLYNFYPDTSAFAHGDELAGSLPEYDCVFYTKKFWEKDARRRIHLQEAVHLAHGYDPELHKPHTADPADIRQYGSDVSVIATHTPHKEKILAELLQLRPELELRIWGNGWCEATRNPDIVRRCTGHGLVGVPYAIALQCAKVNLAIMSGVVSGASQGDDTTTRSYEIPACGGFMLHERNDEILGLYTEDKEIACFGSAEEAASKIDYYLSHPEERRRIAAAGHARCVPSYSYDNRMAELLRWHGEHFPGNRSKPHAGAV
jgi:spore maturation protein CgeB